MKLFWRCEINQSIRNENIKGATWQYLSQKSWYRPSHAVSLHLQMMMVKTRRKMRRGRRGRLWSSWGWRCLSPMFQISILYFWFTLTIVLPLAFSHPKKQVISINPICGGLVWLIKIEKQEGSNCKSASETPRSSFVFLSFLGFGEHHWRDIRMKQQVGVLNILSIRISPNLNIWIIRQFCWTWHQYLWLKDMRMINDCINILLRHCFSACNLLPK